MATKEDIHSEFKCLCTAVVATAHDYPGDGLRALSAALNLCKFDRDHLSKIDKPTSE